MSLLPFLLISGIGAVVALLFRRSERWSAAVGLVALAGSVLGAIAIRPDESLVIGGGGLATTEYLRLFLVLGSIVGLLLAIIGRLTADRRDVPAVTLAVLATSGLALALPDARAAVLAASAGGAAGALLALSSSTGRSGATAGTRALRATAVAGTMAIAATAWIGRDLSELAAQPVVFGLAYLAFALAVAVRFGAIPLHTWAARLADAVPETTLPLITAVAPAALAIVALAWADASIAPLLVDVGSAQAVVLVVAIASITLASIAAWIQDDIEHIVGYAIVGDAGVVLLAIAALDPAAWAPARTWILAVVVTRSAFAAWAAVTRAAFGTGRVPDLRGWALRAPPLAVVLAPIVLASIGIPGLAAAEARGELVGLVVDGPLAALVIVGTLGPLLYYGRLVAVGLERPSGPGAERPAWRPRLSSLDLTDVRGWIARTWGDNRLVSAIGGVALLSLLALAVSAGAFGTQAAAAGLPPSIRTPAESFAPDGPVAPTGSEGPIESESPISSEGPIGSGAPISSVAPIGSEAPISSVAPPEGSGSPAGAPSATP